MDKWIKKLVAPFPKLSGALSRPGPDVERSVKPSDVPSSLSAERPEEGEKENGSALQQTGNLGSGTSAFKNNKAASFEAAGGKPDPKERLTFFGQDNQKNNGNGEQCPENIEVDHKVVDKRHNNYDLVNIRQIAQNTKESTNPDKTTGQLNLSANSGPMNTEAKNICPISEEMSESLDNRGSDNVSASFICHNDTPDEEVLSNNVLSNNNAGKLAENNQETKDGANIGESRIAEQCPYCQSKDFIKRGTRKNKHQVVQLYECKNEECGRTFTAQDIKGKKFPLNVIIEGMSYYNLGFTLEQSCGFLKQKFGVPVPKLSSVENVPKSQQSHGDKMENWELSVRLNAQAISGAGRPSPNSQDSGDTFVPPTPETLSSWIAEYSQLCRYERLRPYAVKMYSPADVVEVVTMAHRQLFRFRYHRAKTRLMLEEEYRNRRLQPLKEFLDNVSSVTPHQYFQEGERMSEIRSKFDKADMIVKSKFNYANRLADFVLQAVKDNKQRHEQLQRFFIANDSCTVATEVPVYIRKEDVEHFENDLRFKITERPSADVERHIGSSSSLGPVLLKGSKKPIPFPKLLTGHIDIVQIRNGQIHLMDYKPDAAKEKPIEQLTWYALAMCRLTGLRLYDFTCAWFDDKDFFQFYPLHVVKKLQGKNRKKRKVFFKDGTWGEATKKDELVIVGRENNS